MKKWGAQRRAWDVRVQRRPSTTPDPRLDAIVNGLDCTGPLGWLNIMKYATEKECVGTYAQLCVAFGPGARKKSKVFFLRHGKVMAFLSRADRVHVFSLVSKEAARGAAALTCNAWFRPYHIMLADGSIALDRVEAARVRFPALETGCIDLDNALLDFTDARRTQILTKLCTFTFVTTLELRYNDIAVVPDAMGALTNLESLNLTGNKIAALPASIGRLAALEELCLDHNILTGVPVSIGALTNLMWLDLSDNGIVTLPDWIGGMTALKLLDLADNQLTALPDSIGHLTGLKSLDLGDNQLTSTIENALPDSIVALTNLTALHLGNNPQLIRSEQSAAVQAWLQALEDSRV